MPFSLGVGCGCCSSTVLTCDSCGFPDPLTLTYHYGTSYTLCGGAQSVTSVTSGTLSLVWDSANNWFQSATISLNHATPAGAGTIYTQLYYRLLCVGGQVRLQNFSWNGAIWVSEPGMSVNVPSGCPAWSIKSCSPLHFYRGATIGTLVCPTAYFCMEVDITG